MSNYRAHDMKTLDTADLTLAALDTNTVGLLTIINPVHSRFVRIRLKCSAVSLGGGTLTATLYHSASKTGTLVSTTKTISITNTTDGYIIINDGDTGLVPLMPYFTVKIASTGAATCTVSDCEIFRT